MNDQEYAKMLQNREYTKLKNAQDKEYYQSLIQDQAKHAQNREKHIKYETRKSKYDQLYSEVQYNLKRARKKIHLRVKYPSKTFDIVILPRHKVEHLLSVIYHEIGDTTEVSINYMRKEYTEKKHSKKKLSALKFVDQSVIYVYPTDV